MEGDMVESLHWYGGTNEVEQVEEKFSVYGGAWQKLECNMEDSGSDPEPAYLKITSIKIETSDETTNTTVTFPRTTAERVVGSPVYTTFDTDFEGVVENDDGLLIEVMANTTNCYLPMDLTSIPETEIVKITVCGEYNSSRK